MKKILIGVGTLIILAVACLPFINGMVMEKAFQHVIDQANEIYVDTEMGMNLEVIRYDRGFSSSEIEYKLNLGKLKDMLKVDSVVVIDRAKHGLTSVTSTSSLEKNPWYTQAIENYVEGSDPLTMETEYKLLGDIISTITIDAFTLKAEGETVDIKPGTITAQTNREFKKFVSEGSWKGLSVGELITFSAMSFESDIELISTFIYRGSSLVTMEGASVEEEGKRVEMKGLKVSSAVQYDDKADRLIIDANYALDLMKTPEGDMENLDLALHIAGVDGTAYEEAAEIYMDMMGSFFEILAQHQDDPEMMEEAMQAQMMGLGMQMVGVYEKFLKQGLELSIKKLKATLPMGNVEGAFSLILNKDVTMAQMLPMATQPNLVFEYLSLNSDVSLPKALTGDNPMLTAPLLPGMETGFFVEDGDYLKHKGITKDNKFFLNGAVVDFNAQ
ncbi:DUF945 family protein [Desulfopila sp. IMCC35008]|uniref:DUF945 family protein n=1 Tax=Desulfopila sp. IMCC35008 TaxID=2653858 RepID=UPI0013D243C0|nr:DUF945 family protein [Desulfopila sp. IMCC35008]